MNMSDLSGKYAIVTGGNRGIGAAIVKRFLDDGCAGVAIFGRRIDQVKAYAAEVDPSGERTLCVACDVGVPEQVHDGVQAVLEKFGRIDFLIKWNEVLNTNLTSMFNTCHEVFPLMRAQQYGHIVNLASGSVWGNIGQANYAAAKAGVLGFTRTLAKEGAGKNVIVNAIAPGVIETDMVRAVPPEKYEAWQKSMPMGRLGDPSELAAVASFLASNDASYVTGQCICVNGGTRM